MIRACDQRDTLRRQDFNAPPKRQIAAEFMATFTRVRAEAIRKRQIRGGGWVGFGRLFIANNLQEVWSLVTQVAVCTCLVRRSGVSGYSGRGPGAEPAVSADPFGWALAMPHRHHQRAPVSDPIRELKV